LTALVGACAADFVPGGDAQLALIYGDYFVAADQADDAGALGLADAQELARAPDG